MLHSRGLHGITWDAAKRGRMRSHGGSGGVYNLLAVTRHAQATCSCARACGGRSAAHPWVCAKPSRRPGAAAARPLPHLQGARPPVRAHARTPPLGRPMTTRRPRRRSRWRRRRFVSDIATGIFLGPSASLGGAGTDWILRWTSAWRQWMIDVPEIRRLQSFWDGFVSGPWPVHAN